MLFQSDFLVLATFSFWWTMVNNFKKFMIIYLITQPLVRQKLHCQAIIPLLSLFLGNQYGLLQKIIGLNLL